MTCQISVPYSTFNLLLKFDLFFNYLPLSWIPHFQYGNCIENPVFTKKFDSYKVKFVRHLRSEISNFQILDRISYKLYCIDLFEFSTFDDRNYDPPRKYLKLGMNQFIISNIRPPSWIRRLEWSDFVKSFGMRNLKRTQYLSLKLIGSKKWYAILVPPFLIFKYPWTFCN